MLSVLIADDHALVRRGIRSLLELHRDITVVGEAADARSALELARQLRPRVVLLDLLLPDADGADTLRQIRRSNPATQVVVLTSYHADDLILRAVEAGALSYLLKDVDPPELVHAVRAAARGETVLHPRVGSQVLRCVRGARAPDPLTRRERTVLSLIARGQSNRDIARGLSVSIETVKTHVSHILAKLGLQDRTQAAIYALNHDVVVTEDAVGPMPGDHSRE